MNSLNSLNSLSIAIPVHNEAEVLPALVHRLVEIMEALAPVAVRITLVDDGSSDGTRDMLRTLVASDSRFEAVLLSRNFGQQAALSAALDRVDGDATIVMDADLQDDPSLIPELIAKYREGFDVVYVVRRTRSASPLLRSAYRIFYWTASVLSSVPLPVQAGDFGLMSKRVVREIRGIPERQRYLRGLRAWVGFSQCGIPADRPDRAAGTSKYSPSKLIQLALDGIFAFSTLPLRLAMLMGAAAIIIAIGWAAFVVYARVFLDQTPAGFSSLIITIVFLAGTNLFFLGIIGEYVGRIYEESKGRPIYIVDELLADEHVDRSESS